MAEMNDMLKTDSIRVCPKCGSVNLSQKPKPWDMKPVDTVVSTCMLCGHKGPAFPIIKKTVVRQFRKNLKK